MVNNTGDLGSLPWRAQLLRVYKRSRHKGPINQRTDGSNQAQNASAAHGCRYGAVRVPCCRPCRLAEVPRIAGTRGRNSTYSPTILLKAKNVACCFPVYRQLAPHALCKSVENRDVCE